jgi:UDP-N-acetylmuramoyl-tripeptide--D-alanyl-D-alanine ligase
LLTRSRFVVVTGSCGKTTTKELTAAVLSSRFRVFKSPANGNLPYHFVRFMFRIRPSHECCVIEAAGASHSAPIDLAGYMGVLKPNISVVTNIGLDHYTMFRDRETVAAHKGKIIDALTAEGTAVLNADDPYVLGMQSRCKGRVLTYGLSDTAMMRASDIDASWPNRLAFVASCGDESVRVQTQLCGAHFVPDVLAALAVGQVMDVPLAAAAEAIREVKPFPSRMSPVETEDGVAFMCDDAKAPLWTMPMSMEFLKNARAKRKILVLGTISDYSGDVRRRYRGVAQSALEVADAVIGVGPNSTAYLRATPNAGQMLKAFADSRQAFEFLRDFLQSGDLVLLKASEVDAMQYIVKRWPSRGAPLKSATPVNLVAEANGASAASAEDLHLVIGLGNPNPDLAETPHNVGQRAVDALASQLGVTWTPEGNALTAETQVGEHRVKLLKLATWMNDTGPVFRAIADRLGVIPEHCIVLFDDIDLPLGTVRPRERGSAGGHKGFASILLAFQSQRVPRVKIGVGRPPDGDIKSFVLRPFTLHQQEAVNAACERATQAVLELVKHSTPIDNSI